MSRQKTAEQAKVAEILAAERAVAEVAAAEAAAEVERKRYKPRDINADFKDQGQRPPEDNYYFGWANSSGGQPPPPVPGYSSAAETFPPHPRPVRLQEAQILAMVYGGGYRSPTPAEKMQRGPGLIHVSLLEGTEKPSLKTSRWFDEPMYYDLKSGVTPWGTPWNDYEAARNEAVKRWELMRRGYTLEDATRGITTTDSMYRSRLVCEGCRREVSQTMGHPEYRKELCRDCAPDLPWIGYVVDEKAEAEPAL